MGLQSPSGTELPQTWGPVGRLLDKQAKWDGLENRRQVEAVVRSGVVEGVSTGTLARRDTVHKRWLPRRGRLRGKRERLRALAEPEDRGPRRLSGVERVQKVGALGFRKQFVGELDGVAVHGGFYPGSF